MVTIRIIEASDKELSLNASIPGHFLAVGMAVFVAQNSGDVVCDLIHVDDGYRRLGVASALYAEAEKHFNMSIRPSKKLTPDSVAFWEARGHAIPEDAEVKSYDAWFGYEENGELDGIEGEEQQPRL